MIITADCKHRIDLFSELNEILTGSVLPKEAYSNYNGGVWWTVP